MTGERARNRPKSDAAGDGDGTGGGTRAGGGTGGGTRAGAVPDGVPDGVPDEDDDLTALDTAALLDAVATTAFRLNGQFLARGDRLAAPAGLTASRWQVLYAVYHEPLPVAGVARAMGVARQSVQRLADVLVEQGLAAYEPNPAHRRAKLLRPTAAGRRALARLEPGHAEFAARLGHRLGGEERFRGTLAALRRLSAAMEALQAEDAEEAEEAGDAESGGAGGPGAGSGTAQGTGGETGEETGEETGGEAGEETGEEAGPRTGSTGGSGTGSPAPDPAPPAPRTARTPR